MFFKKIKGPSFYLPTSVENARISLEQAKLRLIKKFSVPEMIIPLFFYEVLAICLSKNVSPVCIVA